MRRMEAGPGSATASAMEAGPGSADCRDGSRRRGDSVASRNGRSRSRPRSQGARRSRSRSQGARRGGDRLERRERPVAWTAAFRLAECCVAVQPGQSGRALDGEGQGWTDASFYEGKVPPEWYADVQKLAREERVFIDGEMVERMVVPELDFHEWVAGKVSEVSDLSDSFSWDQNLIGRGRRARAIEEAVRNWVRLHSGKAEKAL